METEEQKFTKLRQDCWDNSLHSFGTSYIFNKRAVRYSGQLTFLKIFGIVVPVTVGATASGYGFDSALLKSTVAISIPLSIVQVIYSIFAFGYKWDDNLAYAYESVIDHNNLSEEFKKLAKRPPSNYSEFHHDFSILDTKLKSRVEQDAKHSLTERELRMGMRFALREFKRPCYGCKHIPISMNSTTCPVCGKFKRNVIQQIFNYG
ncbi:MAG: mobilome CxxCx(11)CxxC protein [Cyclobacteriaceae bacterium]